jgi:hypothetical protein
MPVFFAKNGNNSIDLSEELGENSQYYGSDL